MDVMKGSFVCFILAVLGMPSVSYADIKVTLTNGREIIADSCEWEGGRLVCTKMGGTFDIEKQDVAGVKEIKSGGYEPPSGELRPLAPAEQQKNPQSGQGDAALNKENPPTGTRSGDDKRREEFIQKKMALS